MDATLLGDPRRLTAAPSVSDVTTGSPLRLRRASTSLTVALLVFVVGACSSDGRDMRAPRPDQNQSIIPITEPPTQPVAFDTASPDVTDFILELPWMSGSDIPPEFVCAGSAPIIRWSGVPSGAVGLALVVTDLDAPIAGRPELPFVHWAVANIDIGLSSFAVVPADAVEAANDFAPATEAGSNIGWGAPCPPSGSSHTYSFELHALGQSIELPSGSAAADMVKAIEAVSLGRATASGVVRR